MGGKGTVTIKEFRYLRQSFRLPPNQQHRALDYTVSQRGLWSSQLWQLRSFEDHWGQQT